MQKNPNILVVDDDLSILEVIEARLKAHGFRVFKASSAQQALNMLANERPDAIVSDMKMPQMDGMALLARVRAIQPDIPILFLTAYGTIEDAVESIKAGAVDYLTKPFEGRVLVEKLQDILDSAETSSTASDGARDAAESRFCYGRSPAMQSLYEMIERVADSDVSVLILGESGTGKERIARQIHQRSRRAQKPLVVVDCGATPTGLLESELFGHVKGSFTHAVRDKQGLIAAADGGTLFLDEIGNISSDMQLRMLRFLEDRKIRRIGAIDEQSVDCRVLAATNADLRESIAAGHFREDLYYRLRVVTLAVPALRERKEDIPLLAEAFIRQTSQGQDIAPVILPRETLNWLVDYHWPGNVRELKNAIEAGVVLCKHGVLHPDDFQLSDWQDPEDAFTAPSGQPLSLEESERGTIIEALKSARYIQSRAAQTLGISRRAIHYKIKKFGIDVKALKARADRF